MEHITRAIEARVVGYPTLCLGFDVLRILFNAHTMLIQLYAPMLGKLYNDAV